MAIVKRGDTEEIRNQNPEFGAQKVVLGADAPRLGIHDFGVDLLSGLSTPVFVFPVRLASPPGRLRWTKAR